MHGADAALESTHAFEYTRCTRLHHLEQRGRGGGHAGGVACGLRIDAPVPGAEGVSGGERVAGSERSQQVIGCGR